MRKYYQSGEKINLLTAANQIGKSSINIRKMINWATSPNLWPTLWPKSHHNVAQFWYLYPTLDVATLEYKTKWLKEWMPRAEMKDDPVYGYTEEWERKKIKAIHWNSGVSLIFKSYAQNATDLQSGTVHAIFCDEELPISIYDELKFRTSATDGYFHMVFTATLGQYEWECAMEKQGEPEEILKEDSLKIQVSLFDCQEYEDGSKAVWDEKRIQDRINSCSSEAEVQKRVYGRFVQTGDFKYANLITKENLLDDWAYNPKWMVIASVDPGSGGKDGHPTGISFLAVNPEFTEGVIFMGWRGDGIITTQGDAFTKYTEIRGELPVDTQFYDYHAKDFFNIANGAGEKFDKAEKSHDIGEPILKTLIKCNALKIVCGETFGLEQFKCEQIPGELLKLVAELRTLKSDTDKRNAKDDLIDTVRYNCAKVPWDMKKILSNAGKKERKKKEHRVLAKTNGEIVNERREMFMGGDDLLDEINQEIDYWNGYGEF